MILKEVHAPLIVMGQASLHPAFKIMAVLRAAFGIRGQMGKSCLRRKARIECVLDGIEHISYFDLTVRRAAAPPIIFNTSREQILLDEDHVAVFAREGV